MATNLSSLQTKLNNLADETVDATKATAWINDVYKDVAARSDWSWLQANSNFQTVIGQYNYTLASDLMKLFQVRTASRALTPQNRDWLFQTDPAYPQGGNNGEPQFVVQYGNELWLYPKPATEQMVYYLYRKTITDLTNPTDEPLIPEEHRSVLALGAYLKWLIADEADKYMIDNAKNEYEQAIGNMVNADNATKNLDQYITWGRREI